MGLNPEITDKPPGGVLGVTTYQEGSSQDDVSAEESVANAVEDAGEASKVFIDITNPPEGLGGNIVTFTTIFNGGTSDFASSVRVGTYRFFGYSGTCFLKAFWDEVLYNAHPDGTPIPPEVSRTPKNFEFGLPGSDGTCLIDGFDIDVPDTWDSSDDLTVEQPMPDVPAEGETSRQQLNIENFVFAQVDSYTPPSDGSANGFPV